MTFEVDAGRGEKVRRELEALRSEVIQSDPDARHVLGYLLEAEGLLDSARSVYEQNFGLPDIDVLANRMALGRVCFKLGKYDQAFNYLQMVAREDSCYDWVQYRLCTALNNMGQAKSAIQHCERQLICTPGDSATTLKTGQLCFDLDRLDEARSYALAYLSLRHSDDAILLLAETFAGSNDMEGALNILDSVIAARGPNASILARRAYVLSGFEEYELMKEDLRNALAMDSGEVMALRLVDLHADLGDITAKDSLLKYAGRISRL